MTQFYTLTQEQRAAIPVTPVTPGAPRDYWQAILESGQVELLHVAGDAPLGYNDPVIEHVNDRYFAVAYPRGSLIERTAEQERLATIALQQQRAQAVVSPFQARAALAAAGLLAQVEAIVADPATPDLVRLAWHYASEFRRDSPTLAALASQLALDDTALDELFATAAGITA